MQYIISEDELKDLLNMHIPYFGTRTISELHQLLVDFLKSKKPVEEIARGKISHYPSIMEDKIIIHEINQEVAEKYRGKSIKLYLEEL
jgi:hypothetical protein